MSRPIRRDETPATEVGSRVPVSLKKSPAAELAGRMLSRFGSSVRDRPPLLPLVAKELPSALFSAAEAQVDRIAKRLLGEAVEPEATAAAEQTPASAAATLAAISASIAKAETPGAGFQFLRALLVVLTLGLWRLKQKKPLTDWVQQRLKQATPFPQPLTPTFCAEVICLKQLERGLLDQTSPAAHQAARQLGELLRRYRTEVEQAPSSSASPIERTLASSLLAELDNAGTDTLLQTIVQYQLDNWIRELPQQIKVSIQSPDGQPSADALAGDLEIVQQFIDSPRGGPIKTTLATAFPLGLHGARLLLQSAWRKPKAVLLDHLCGLARLLRAYSPFFQSAQISSRLGVPEASPDRWLSETWPKDTAGLQGAVESEAEQLGVAIVDVSSPSSAESRAVISSRLRRLASLYQDVPQLAVLQPFGTILAAQIGQQLGQQLRTQGSPEHMVRILTHVNSLLAEVPEGDQKALKLERLPQDAWSVASLKQPMIDRIKDELLGKPEGELAELLTNLNRHLSDLEELVGQSSLRSWVTEALKLAAKEQPALQQLAEGQLVGEAIDLMWLAPRPPAEDPTWADTLKGQLLSLSQITSNRTTPPDNLLNRASAAALGPLAAANSAENLFERAEQLAAWSHEVQAVFPGFSAIEFCRETLRKVALPKSLSQEDRTHLGRKVIDETHDILREPVLALQPKHVAALSLLGIVDLAQQPAGQLQRWNETAPGEISQSLRACPVDQLQGRWSTLRQIGAAVDAALQVTTSAESGSAESGSAKWLANGLELSLEQQAEAYLGDLETAKPSTSQLNQFNKLWELAGSSLPAERLTALAARLTSAARAWAQALFSANPLTPQLLQQRLPWDRNLGWARLVREGGEAQMNELIRDLEGTPAENALPSFLLAARKMGSPYEVPEPPSPAALQGLMRLAGELQDPARQTELAALFPGGQPPLAQPLVQLLEALKTTLERALGPDSALLKQADSATVAALLQEALDANLRPAAAITAILSSYLSTRLATRPANSLLDGLQGTVGPVADLMRVVTTQMVLAQPAAPELPVTADELERVTDGVDWPKLAKAFPGQTKSFATQMLKRVGNPQELAESLRELGAFSANGLAEPLAELVASAMERVLDNTSTASDRAKLAELFQENKALLLDLPDDPASVAAYLLPRDRLQKLFEQEIPAEQLGRVLTALNLRIQEGRSEDDSTWLRNELYNRFKSPDAPIQPSKDLFFEDGSFTSLAQTIIDHAEKSGMDFADFLPMPFQRRNLTGLELDKVAEFTTKAQERILEGLAAARPKRRGVAGQEVATPDPELINRLSPQLLLGWLQAHPDRVTPKGIVKLLMQRLLEVPEDQLALLEQAPVKTKGTRTAASEILGEARETASNRIRMRHTSLEATQQSLMQTLAEDEKFQRNLLHALSTWRNQTMAIAQDGKSPTEKELRALLETGRPLEARLREMFEAQIQLPGGSRSSEFVQLEKDVKAGTPLLLDKLSSLPESSFRGELLQLAPMIRTYLRSVVPKTG